MCDSSHIGGSDLEELARRFIAETCDFLTANWDVEEVGWPRRREDLAAAALPAEQGPPRNTFVDEAAQPAAVVTTELVHRLIPLIGAKGRIRLGAQMGGVDDHVYVVVPAAAVPVDMYIHCLPCYPQPKVLGHLEDEDWPIWVPEVAREGYVAAIARATQLVG
jgi:hypothetical protein